MAAKRAFCVLFVSFFALGSATYCTDKGDCLWSESCCSDSVCRETCYYCTYDSNCGTGEVCCDGDCKSSCSVSGGVIAAAIVSTIVFCVIIASIVACFCCACCPYYRYRSPGTVIVSQPGYQGQPFVSTTHTTVATQQQHYPPPANYNQPPPPGYNQPPPPGYNQPPPPGYNQPPPPYPNYPQPPAQYPPFQAQGQSLLPPPVSVGQPVKY